jgi:outer membrane protein assembly factor BamB
VGNVSSLQLLWAASVAGGVTNFAVDDGVLYATGQANNLVALNATTGAQLWSVNNLGNGGENGDGAIATGVGLVFAQCGFTDQGGTAYGAICAYKPKTGKMVWQYSNPCNCLPEASVESPLVFADGVLYFGYSTGGGGETHGIYAVHAATGKQLWGYGAYNNSLGIGPAAVEGSDVYLDFNDPPQSAEIIALTTSNGTVNWTAPISTANAGVSVSGGVVYASAEWTGTDATVYALNKTTGATLWSYTYATGDFCGGGESPSPPAIAKGIVYFQGVDGSFYALKAKTGKLMWADTPNRPSGQCNYFTSSPSIANGVVYISGGDDAGAAPNTTATTQPREHFYGPVPRGMARL